MATRSPRRGPAAMVPPISWPGTTGRAEPDGPDATLQEPVQVRAADAHGVDAHEGLTGARHRIGFLRCPQVAWGVEPDREHRQAPGWLVPGRVARRVSTARWMSAATPAATTATTTSWTMATW